MDGNKHGIKLEPYIHENKKTNQELSKNSSKIPPKIMDFDPIYMDTPPERWIGHQKRSPINRKGVWNLSQHGKGYLHGQTKWKIENARVFKGIFLFLMLKGM